MNLNFTLNETRILGCLIEKEITTPEQYPLSLNALTNAANQKSNRDPVLSLDENTVQETIDELIKQRLVVIDAGHGNRVMKYKHRFCNTEFSELKLSEQELGIICVLFLRGAQTPGELRTRTNRLCHFNDVQEVETVLTQLTNRSDGPFVIKLSREPGKRESRYAHLLSGDVAIDIADNTPNTNINETDPDTPSSYNERIDTLETEVRELRSELENIKGIIDELL